MEHICTFEKLRCTTFVKVFVIFSGSVRVEIKVAVEIENTFRISSKRYETLFLSFGREKLETVRVTKPSLQLPRPQQASYCSYHQAAPGLAYHSTSTAFTCEPTATTTSTYEPTNSYAELTSASSTTTTISTYEPTTSSAKLTYASSNPVI